MINIDIWGTCVTRDIFGIGGDGDVENRKQYNINTYLQMCSIVSAFQQHVGPDIDLDNINMVSEKRANFINKCLIADYNKTAVDQLRKSDSEWLVIDLRTEAYGLCKIVYKPDVYEYITNTVKLDWRLQVIRTTGVHFDYNIIYPDDFNYLPYLDKLVNFIRERYGDKVILIESRDSYDILSDNGDVNIFSPNENYILFESYLNYEFIKRCSPYVIKSPFNNIADQYHKWGVDHVHYLKEYYDYALKCIDIITHGSNREVILSSLNIEFFKIIWTIQSIRVGKIKSIENTSVRIEYLLKDKKYDLALSLIRDLEQINCPKAYQFLGYLYKNGFGVPKNLDLAIVYYEKAVDNHLYYTINDLFELYHMVCINGGDEIINKMFKVATLGADNNIPEMLVKLGRLYRDGIGTRVDLVKARLLIKKGIDFGCTWAVDDYNRLMNNCNCLDKCE